MTPTPLVRVAVVLVVLLGGCGRGTADDGSVSGSDSTSSTTQTSTTTESTSATSTTTEAVPRAGFVVFGDSGGGPAQLRVARAMERWAEEHPVDALVTTGDNVYERGEPERFAAQLDEPYAKLRAERPLWVTLGNHDVAAGHGPAQLRHLRLPPLPYAKELPGVQLLFLDGNRPGSAQARWLDRTLAAPGPALRVVVFHQPVWSCGPHGSTASVQRWWEPVLERRHVALVLNGHDHNYQRFTSARGVNYVVTGGGGRGLYGMGNKCPSNIRLDAREGRFHFVAVAVEGRRMAVTTVAEDGSVLDRMTLSR